MPGREKDGGGVYQFKSDLLQLYYNGLLVSKVCIFKFFDSLSLKLI